MLKVRVPKNILWKAFAVLRSGFVVKIKDKSVGTVMKRTILAIDRDKVLEAPMRGQSKKNINTGK